MSHDKTFLVIKTGSKLDSLASVPGDYEDWILAGMGRERRQARVVAVDQGEALPPAASLSAVAITGSGCMVTDADAWIEETAVWLRSAVESGLPVLGICFGHQLLAHALGGRVGWNPSGVEVGTVEITRTAEADRLLDVMPEVFPAQVSHRQSVLELPDGARRLAHSELEANHALVVGEKAWGLQFHPEFDDAIIRHFVRYYKETLKAEGKTMDELLKQARPSAEASSLLARFAAQCRLC